MEQTQRTESQRSAQEWKTALYARLSCENNGLIDDRSLKNQVQYEKDYIAMCPDMKLVDEYVDNGHTGTNFYRPEFTRMMEDLKTGRINCIVVKDLSRFGRNYLETGYYLEKIFPFLNVRFLAINDNYDSMDKSMGNNLIVPIKNIVNEIYAKDISRKITATMRMKEKSGKIRYGMAPYGYVRDAQNPFRVSADAETAPYVKLMFLWARQNMSYGEISRRLECVGAVAPSQRSQCGEVGKCNWDASSVRNILHNQIYVGDMVYNRTRQSLADGEKHHRQSRENWLVVPDAHTALISREDFAETSEILERRRQNHVKREAAAPTMGESARDELDGLFYCSDCGGKMLLRCNVHNGATKRYAYYCSCSRHKSEGSNRGRLEISDRLIRTLVLDQIRLQTQASCSAANSEKILATLDAGLAGQSNSKGQKTDRRKIIKDIGSSRLSYELAHSLISRIEFGSDKVLRITFRHRDCVREPAAKEGESL